MKLYPHSVRWPAAMQIFLNANPHYWRLVRMVMKEAEVPLQSLIQRQVLTDQLDWNLRSIDDCRVFVEAVLKPPAR